MSLIAQPINEPSELMFGNVSTDSFIKITLIIVFIILVCVVIYFICSNPRSKRSSKYTLYGPRFGSDMSDELEQEPTIPNAALPAIPVDPSMIMPLEATPPPAPAPAAATQGGDKKEGFTHRRLVAGFNGENIRPNEGVRIDNDSIVESMKSVNEASDGKLFCGIDKPDKTKSARNDKTYYMDKVNGSRWKRGVCRQQQNKKRDYHQQSTVNGLSTANDRVNYTGLSSLGTVKGHVPECDNVRDAARQVHALPPTKKGTEMFRNLDDATLDDRGYANPEAFTPTNDGFGQISNMRMAGANMNLNALNGTMWKKHKVGNPTSPYPAELNIMEGHAAPFKYVANPDW